MSKPTVQEMERIAVRMVSGHAKSEGYSNEQLKGIEANSLVSHSTGENLLQDYQSFHGMYYFNKPPVDVPAIDPFNLNDTIFEMVPVYTPNLDEFAATMDTGEFPYIIFFNHTFTNKIPSITATLCEAGWGTPATMWPIISKVL